MRKTLTLAIVFLLIVPTFSVLLPKVQAEAYTFGKTDIGGSNHIAQADDIVGSRYTLSEDGDVSDITVYLYISFIQYLKCAIYDKGADGNPDNLMGVTEERYFPFGANWDWQTFNFTTPLRLSAGDYFLIVWSSNSWYIVKYDSGTRMVRKNVAYNSFPDPFGPPADTWSRDMSIYASYTPSGPRTWTVDDDRVECPDADFTSIQEAINASRSGDTIQVYPGTYNESPTVYWWKEDISLVGNSSLNTIITGSLRSEALSTMNYITIRNFEIQGSLTFSPLGGMGVVGPHRVYNNVVRSEVLLATHDSIVQGNFIEGSLTIAAGFHGTAHGNVIENNTLVGSGIEIWGSVASGARQNVIKNNTVINASIGVLDFGGTPFPYFYGSLNNSITENRLIQCGIGVKIGQPSPLPAPSFSTVHNNTFEHNNYGILLGNATDATISHNFLDSGGYGIHLEYSSNNTIYGNNITNNYYGVWVEYSSNITIHVNNVSANEDHGIRFRWTDGCRVFDNIVNDNYDGYGIWLTHSNEDVVKNNTANRNYNHNIIVEYATNTTVAENIADDCVNSYGTIQVSGNYCSVLHNMARGNYAGFDVEGENLVFCGNLVENNVIGLRDYSSKSFFYHNNFTNNTKHVYSWGSTNVWDNGYPSGGNYWSDYNGTDLCHGPFQNISGSDGIGDTPYRIDSNNTDHYPLIAGSPPSTPIVLSPKGGEFWSGTQSITWSNSTDPDGDPVTYEIEYSVNSGTNWTTLATGISGTSYTWNTTLYPDSNNYLVRVRAYDGVQCSSWDECDDIFAVDNKLPEVAIVHPTEGEEVTAGIVWVNGTVMELNKGTLQPSIASIPSNASFVRVEWNGTFFAFKNSSIIAAGPISVTVSFTDLAGNTGLDTVSFSYRPFGEETELSVSVTPSSALVGYEVEIVGRLTWRENGTGIADAPILVSYQYHPDLTSYIPAGQKWNVISTVTTTADGSYSATWFVMSSGIYRIEVFYPGSAQAYPATSTASLLIADLEGKIFSVSSNSTVSNMNFNSTAKEIKFTVSGLNGTAGYLDIFLAKSLIPDVSGLKIYFDGEEKSFDAILVDDTWFIRLTYTHSSHTVRISLSQSLSPILSRELMIITIGIAVIGSMIALLLLRKKRRERAVAPSLQREQWHGTECVSSKKLTL